MKKEDCLVRFNTVIFVFEVAAIGEFYLGHGLTLSSDEQMMLNELAALQNQAPVAT
jgi:hypothetical protein